MKDDSVGRIRHIKKRAFLKAYALCGYVTHAAWAAKIHRDTHYAWLKSDPDYAERFKEAKQRFIELLEAEIDRRAFKGVEEPIIQGGKVVKDKNGNPIMRKRYSDVLAMFRLKRLDPSYRDNYDPSVSRDHNPDPERLKETLRFLEEHGFKPSNPVTNISGLAPEGAGEPGKK